MISNDDDLRKLIDASDWVLVTRNDRFLSDLDSATLPEAIGIPTKLRLWTDDYNNVFQILRPVRFHEVDSK